MGPVPQAREDLRIPFSLPSQIHSEWCWLAVAAGVARYVNREIRPTYDEPSQCELASRFVEGRNGEKFECCTKGTVRDCNQQGAVSDVLQRIGLAVRVFDRPLTFKEIRSIIGKRLPVIVRIGWRPDDSGHFVVIYGCRTVMGQQVVAVRDPLYPDTYWDYHYFVHHYRRTGRWTHTIRLVQGALLGKS